MHHTSLFGSGLLEPLGLGSPWPRRRRSSRGHHQQRSPRSGGAFLTRSRTPAPSLVHTLSSRPPTGRCARPAFARGSRAARPLRGSASSCPCGGRAPSWGLRRWWASAVACVPRSRRFRLWRLGARGDGAWLRRQRRAARVPLRRSRRSRLVPRPRAYSTAAGAATRVFAAARSVATGPSAERSLRPPRRYSACICAAAGD